MNLKEWNEIAELAGIAAVVGSLIFVGLQVKQSQEIAESEAYQARAATSIELAAAEASTPEFTSGMAKLYVGDVAGLTGQEVVALEYFYGAEMLRYENHHYQYEAGFLPKEHWDRNLSEMKCLFSQPYLRNITAGWEWRESFQEIIDEQMARADSEPNDCWQ